MPTPKSAGWIKYNLIQKEEAENEGLSLGENTEASLGQLSVSAYLVEQLDLIPLGKD